MTSDRKLSKKALLRSYEVKKGYEIIKHLIEAGADVNKPDIDGRTPLHVIAGEFGVYSIVDLLLKAGANPNVATKEGITPLHLATKYDSTSNISLLVKFHADIHAECKNKETPLTVGVIENNPYSVRDLLEYKANPNQKLSNGITILEYAIRKGYKEMVDVLLKNNADTNQTLSGNESSVYLAASIGRRAIIKLLVVNLADTLSPVEKEVSGLREFYKDHTQEIKSRLEILIKSKQRCGNGDRVLISPVEIAQVLGNRFIIDLLSYTNKCRHDPYRYHALRKRCSNINSFDEFKQVDQLAQRLKKLDFENQHTLEINQAYLNMTNGIGINTTLKQLDLIKEKMTALTTNSNRYEFWKTNTEKFASSQAASLGHIRCQ